MMKREELSDKYYRGETSLDEEKLLRELFTEDENDSSEKDFFGYLQIQNNVPADLENTVYSNFSEKIRKRKIFKYRILSISSAAAAILIFLSLYLNFQNKKNTRMEQNFLVMEKALFQVSESIQPEEQEEMFVLWVDNNFEIIIN